MDEKRTILVIDDDADLTQIIQTVLVGAGYDVVTASNGVEGLEQLEKVTPHLIILDMNMPKMGGISFYHAIANQYDGSSKYPVLVLTARANLEQLFKDFNVDGFMSKPFEIDLLLKEIDIIISKRHHVPSAESVRVESKAKSGKKPKKVLIAENDADAFNKTVVVFANEGCIVDSVKKGAAVIERAMSEPPDIILLKLGLEDLPGDIVASKLKQMPKTMDIPIVLYTPENKDLNYDVTNNICARIGIKNLIETDDPHVLFKEASAELNKS